MNKEAELRLAELNSIEKFLNIQLRSVVEMKVSFIKRWVEIDAKGRKTE